MTNKKHTLQDRLARSLDQMNKREAKTQTTTAELPPVAARKCTKKSISLFQTDLARLDGIRSFMETNGQRISISQAVKLALRTAPLSKDLVAAMDAIKEEDGRA
jgi:hypothetical protein